MHLPPDSHSLTMSHRHKRVYMWISTAVILNKGLKKNFIVNFEDSRILEIIEIYISIHFIL